MVIYGVALLAICTLLGAVAGDAFGVVLGVKANVGGVGIAMLLLIAARSWLQRTGRLSDGANRGVAFWEAMYIPIVVAMAANQNVAEAFKSGPLVVITGTLSVLLCFAAVALIGRTGGPQETIAEIEAGEREKHQQ